MTVKPPLRAAAKDPILLVLAGPAGSGKSTLCDRLVAAGMGFSRVVTSLSQRVWVGMFVPSKTPRDIVARLHADTVKALQSPEVKARYARLGAETQIFTPEQFDVYIREEVASNAALVRAAGIKVQ